MNHASLLINALLLQTPVKAIRAFCLKCQGGMKAVRICESKDCDLYPYRMGRNSNRKGIGGKRKL
jgi:hypothetical protein